MTIRFGNKIIAGYPDKFVFSLVPVPASATVTITGGTQVKNAVIAKAGTSVHWKVEAAGYEPMEGDKIIGNADESLMVELVEVQTGIFTINPTPADAIVKLTVTSGTGIVDGNSVTCEYDSTVSWEVSADGYDPQQGVVTISKPEEVLDVVLVEAGPIEEFKFTVNSGSDSKFILPLYSRYSSENPGTEIKKYNLNVDWGDGKSEVLTGISSYNFGVTHNYANSNKDYEITLTPVGEDLDGWLSTFGFDSGIQSSGGPNAPSNSIKVKSINSPYTKNMIIRGNNLNFILAGAWSGCTGLTEVKEGFNLPQDISTVGSWFCGNLFQGCSSLEILPSSMNLPQGITGAVGEKFLYYTFKDCTNLQQLPANFAIPKGISSAGVEFLCSMCESCSSLKKVPESFKALQNVTTVDQSFCYSTFKGCSSIKTGAVSFFGNIKLSSEELERLGSYWKPFWWCFNSCSGITEEISPGTIPQLRVSPRKTNFCFEGANPTAIANCPANWK